MKDQALELAAREKTASSKLNVLREYLQAYLLRALQDRGFFRSTAFVGGTALRFLHDLPRYSEDLDFSSANPKQARPFSEMVRALKNECEAGGYNVTVSLRPQGAVQNAFFGFSGLLFEAGLPPMENQNLSVKLEVDTRPPRGARVVTQMVNKHFLLSFLTYDIPSLFAGKMHAVLSRRYTKGRDVYDIMWYLTKWKGLSPNLVLLNNALIQTGWKGPRPAAANWRTVLSGALEKLNWTRVKKDVEPFLALPGDLSLMLKDNIKSLVLKTTE